MPTKKKTTKSKKPFASKSPRGKSKVHVLVAVDDRGETMIFEPDHNASESIAIESTIEMMYLPDATARVVDVQHFVLEVTWPKPRKLEKAKKKTGKKIRDGKAIADKEAKAKKDEDAKATKAKSPSRPGT